MKDKKVKIFVIDDDPSVLWALERLLTSAAYKVETFINAGAYLEREPYQDIGCILLDINMPEMSGTKLQARLLELHHEIPIRFLTAHGDISTSVEAMKLGAVDFLTKPVDEKSMFMAIEQALAQHRKVVANRLNTEETQQRVNALTQREREVMCYVIGGALNKQIASRLEISEKTVKAHRGQVMHKMEADSVADLVRLCEVVNVPVERTE